GATSASGEDLETALGASERALDDFIDGFSSEESARVREAQLADKLEEAQKGIVDADTALATAKKAFQENATAAEKKLATQYEARAAALDAAKESRDGLRDDAESAVAAFTKAQN